MAFTNKVVRYTAGLCCVAAACMAILSSQPALGLTGEDVLNKMSSDHRIGYLAGTVEMAAFLTSVAGEKDRADCIMSWFYEDNGTKTVVKALDRYRDREALSIIQALIERKCGS